MERAKRVAVGVAAAVLVAGCTAGAQDARQELARRVEAYRNRAVTGHLCTGPVQREIRSRDQAYRAWQRSQDSVRVAFGRAVARGWGATRTLSPKRWVAYTADTAAVCEVDFEQGALTVAMPCDTPLEDETMLQRITAVVRALAGGGAGLQGATPCDHATVRQVEHQVAASIRPAYGASLCAENFVTGPGGRIVLDTIVVQGALPATVARVTVPFVPDHLQRRVQPYLHAIRRNCSRFGLDEALVLAVIHTESAFNPAAVSSAGAVGLMQLVPASGGCEAHSYLTGATTIPTRDHLFDPDNNIELGCVYLMLLLRRTFGDVADTLMRQYSAIAAYNGGPGAVAAAVSGSRVFNAAVIERINAFPAASMYLRRLTLSLPARETREYLQAVCSRIDLYTAQPEEMVWGNR